MRRNCLQIFCVLNQSPFAVILPDFQSLTTLSDPFKMRAELKQKFDLVCLSQDAKRTGTEDSTDHHQGQCWEILLESLEADFLHADGVRK